ncbi:growth hormone secretagogue receptor type 1-like [Homarus americanus]|uniref:growth hormone secretagogue receptor type 1-like n=1 Tax=Homarus americanus TaxID=6706 RepID=UPI001C47BC28|nr:growth hormone secretagogue receptor type 1-like [Homarus americanus]
MADDTCEILVEKFKLPLWNSLIQMTLSLILVAESGITIYVNCRSLKLREKTSTKLVTSLAVSSGLSGFLVFILMVVKLIPMAPKKSINEYLLELLIIAPRTLHLISVLFLCCLTLDRYLAICWPLRYHDLMTESRCRLLVMGCWLLTLMVVCVLNVCVFLLSKCKNSLDNLFFFITFYLLTFTLAIIAIMGMYFLIAREFWRKRHQTSEVTKAMQDDIKRLREKTTRDVLVIVLLNLIFASPDVILKLLWLVSKDMRKILNEITPLLLHIHLLFFLPLFAWRNADFNAALLTCCFAVKT